MGKANTEIKLLEATMQLMSEKGYLGATTREIASMAGVTELTLFRRFGSKERLFEEVLKRYTFLPRLKEILPDIEALPYDKGLRLVGIRFFETLKERKTLFRIMLSEISSYPEKIKDIHNSLIDEVFHILTNYLRSLQQKGIVRKTAFKTAARAFLGMVFTYFLGEEIIRGRNISRHEMENMIGEFAEVFIHGTLEKK
jgi:AcrR family transcriptional regulator